MIHSAWSDFAAEHPRVLEAAQQYGSNEAKLDQTLISLWTERLESLLEMTTSDGVTREGGGGNSNRPCMPISGMPCLASEGQRPGTMHRTVG